MQRIDRLRRISGIEWRLMAEALWMLTQIRVALRIHPFKRVQQRYARRTQPKTSAPTPRPRNTQARAIAQARAIGIAVRRSSRLLPAATCLPQALTTRVMLERRGIPNELLFGVAKSDAACRPTQTVQATGPTPGLLMPPGAAQRPPRGSSHPRQPATPAQGTAP